MATAKEREKRIQNICKTINNGDFGGKDKNAVTFLGSRDIIPMERFPTGCAALDDAIGGGYPRGRFVEIFGPESGGKTTACYHSIAEFQKAYPDEDVAFIDTEYAFDEEYAAAIGVNTKYMLVCQPDSGEQALNVLKQLINLGTGLIIVDSVAALTTKAELEGDLGDKFMAEQARLMSQSLRQLAAIAGRNKATVIWTNQVREKIGVLYGNPETTPAGRALRHYASIRIRISKLEVVKEEVEGNKIAVSTKVRADPQKNKCIAEGEILYLPGIGKCVEVEKLLEYRGLPVLSFDGSMIVPGKAVGCFIQNKEECLQVSIRGIGSTIVNYDHPYLTHRGYVKASELKKGDLVASACRVPFEFDGTVDATWTVGRASVCGLLAGDGYTGGKTGVALRSFSKGSAEFFLMLCSDFDCEVYEKDGQHGMWVVRQKGGGHKGKRNPLYDFLRTVGLWGKRAWEKEMPADIFKCSPMIRWAFIGSYIAADGWVSQEGDGQYCVGISTTSKKMVEGFRILFLSLGIVPVVSHRLRRSGGLVGGRKIAAKRDSYQLRVRRSVDVKKIVDNVLWSDGKLGIEIRDCGDGERIPLSMADEAIDAAKKFGLSASSFVNETGWGNAKHGWGSCLGVKRETMTASKTRTLRLLELLGDNSSLEIPMDVVWKPIVSVRPAGGKVTYDIADSPYENFLIQGAITHNTAPPYRRAEFYIVFGRGFDQVAAILDSAISREIVQTKGSWFSFDGENIAQGRYNTLEAIRNDSELLQDITDALVGEAPVVDVEAEVLPGKDGIRRRPVTDIDAIDPDALAIPEEAAAKPEVKVEDV